MCGADCLPVSESGTELKYLSVGFIIRISQATLMVRLKIFDSYGFFARTELALAGVDSLVLLGRKRDRGKTRLSYVVVQTFLLSARPNSPLSNSFFICSLKVGYLPFLGSSTPAMLPVFLRFFRKCSIK